MSGSQERELTNQAIGAYLSVLAAAMEELETLFLQSEPKEDADALELIQEKIEELPEKGPHLLLHFDQILWLHSQFVEGVKRRRELRRQKQS